MQIKLLADLIGIVDNTPPKFHYYKRMRDNGMIYIFASFRPWRNNAPHRGDSAWCSRHIVKDPAVDPT